MKRLSLILTAAAVLALVAAHAHALSIATSTPDFFAWGGDVGWLNWGSSQGAVVVPAGDGELTGYVWGENVGWISLNCSNSASCGTIDYKVTKTSNVIEGYGWGENAGWISFNCTNTASCGTVPYGVTYNATTEEFEGYAWGENIEWVNMNCSNDASCGTVDFKVKTATPTPTPTSGGGGGSFVGTPTPVVTPAATAAPSPAATPKGSPAPTPSVFPTPTSSPPVVTPSSSPQPTTPPIIGLTDRIAGALDGLAQRLFGDLCVGPVGLAACGATAMSSLAIAASFLAALIQSEWAAASFSLFQVVGLRKRAKVWGVVYDSSTKRPIPLPKLELLDSANRVLETRYGDRDGRYGFLTSPASLHEEELHVKIKVSKPGFRFPTEQALSPTDYIVYENTYRGGDITIKGDSLLNFNIPMDAAVRGRLSLSGFGQGLLGSLGDRLLSLGFYIGLIAVPLNWYFMPSVKNLVIGVVFIIANAIRMLALYRPYGVTVDALTGKRVPFALVTLNDLDGTRQGFAVSDEHGRFILSGEPEKDYELTAYTPANVTPQRTIKRRVRGLKRLSTRAWITEKLRI